MDNSLLSLFLTSLLSHFETSHKKVIYIFKKKQIRREKKKPIKVFAWKIKRFFLVRLLFSILIVFSVSLNLANIRVDIAHNLIFFSLFGKYLIYSQNNQVSIFYIVSTTELRKKYVYRGGVAGHWAGTVCTHWYLRLVKYTGSSGLSLSKVYEL